MDSATDAPGAGAGQGFRGVRRPRPVRVPRKGCGAVRIGLLVGSGNPSFGGVEQHVIHLANGLTALGHTAFVLMGSPCPINAEHGLRPDVEQFRVPVPDGGSLPRFLTTGLGVLRRRRPDVLHSHLTYALVLGVLARAVLGRPVVHTEHFVVRKSADRGLRGEAGALLRGRADALIGVSRLVTAECPVLGGRPARYTIYNGTVPAPLRTSPSPPGRLLYVGRLEPDKRVEVVLEVVRRLRDQGYTLDIVGTGSLEERLRGGCKDLENAGVVRWHGWQSDVRPFLREAGALVQPAREGLGYAALEAAAHGVPLVVPAASGASEVVGMTRYGVVIEADSDVGAWVSAVQELSGLPMRPQPLPGVFRVEQMVASTVGVYQALASTPDRIHPGPTPAAARPPARLRG